MMEKIDKRVWLTTLRIPKNINNIDSNKGLKSENLILLLITNIIYNINDVVKIVYQKIELKEKKLIYQNVEYRPSIMIKIM